MTGVQTCALPIWLEAETLRDTLLALSGKLSDKMFGPAVPVMADEVGQFVVGIENLNAGRPQGVIPLGEEEFRRSVYVQVRRSRPLSVLAAFDAPLMEPNCESRNSSTVAPQSLMLMNNDFVLAQSRAFARRIEQEAGPELRAQVMLAWRMSNGAELDETKLAELVEFLNEQAAHFATIKPVAKGEAVDAPHLALASLCQALWSSNSFLYVD